VLAEVRAALKSRGRIDWITFSGSGEPTLHSGIGNMIRAVKRLTHIPVAVLTNGTLLWNPAARRDLAAADLVIPDLDAGSAGIFRRVNRPHPSLGFKKVVRGIEEFTRHFTGRVWLEVVLVRGINDSVKELRRIAALAARIGPERVQLNTVVRPPAEKSARPLNAREMRTAKSVVEKIVAPIPVDVVGAFRGRRGSAHRKDPSAAILAYLKRRPATVADLSMALSLRRDAIVTLAKQLADEGRIRSECIGGTRYYLLDATAGSRVKS
jgi:wyosine [tRNA(Phe)-imidazoG37] synthetase (radical SAM superfamily)